MASARRATLLSIVAAVAFTVAPSAAADLADETALAQKYAPVVRLVEQTEECGPGEAFQPTDVDVLFGDRTVALRGPMEPGRPGQDRPRGGPGRPLGVPPRLSRVCARSGVRLRALARRLTEGALRPSTPTSRARHADPAGSPCSTGSSTRTTTSTTCTRATGRPSSSSSKQATPGRRWSGIRSQSATARTRAPRVPTGATIGSRSSMAPTRSSTRLPARTPTSSRTRCTWGARPRPASAATTREDRTASCARS